MNYRIYEILEQALYNLAKYDPQLVEHFRARIEQIKERTPNEQPSEE